MRESSSSSTRSHQLPPDFESLRIVRALARSCLAGDADSDALYLVAVSEIATNAIEAHQRHHITDHFTVEIDPVGGAVTIRDHGKGLDAPQPEHPPAPSDTRGRGLFLARSICPNLTIDSTERGTRVTLPTP